MPAAQENAEGEAERGQREAWTRRHARAAGTYSSPSLWWGAGGRSRSLGSEEWPPSTESPCCHTPCTGSSSLTARHTDTKTSGKRLISAHLQQNRCFPSSSASNNHLNRPAGGRRVSKHQTGFKSKRKPGRKKGPERPRQRWGLTSVPMTTSRWNSNGPLGTWKVVHLCLRAEDRSVCCDCTHTHTQGRRFWTRRVRRGRTIRPRGRRRPPHTPTLGS